MLQKNCATNVIKKNTEDFIGKITQGDTLTVLKQMPDEFVDMIITSPPYYGLRNYGVDGQLGLEDTFEEFVNKFLEITAELKRVLKKSGSFWLNFGDCYGGSGMGMSYAGQTCGPNSILKGKLDKFPKVGHSKGNMDKCLLLMPERIAIKLIDEQNFILRNKIKWAKQIYISKERRTIGSVMPTSVKDRFNESGEELYFFVKNKKYYSDLDAVRLKNQVIGISDFRQNRGGFVRTPELYLNSKYRDKNYRGKFAGNPNSEMFNSPRARTQRKNLESRMEDTKDKNIKQSRNYNIKKLLSEVRLGIKPNMGIEPNKVKDPRGNHEGGPGSWRDFKDANPNDANEFNPLGKNLPTVWQIGSEPHNFKNELNVDIDHFAIFPQALLEIPIKFGSPVGGIILDPFMGSGTTALMAKKLGRNYIGIELSADYCKLSENRLAQQILNML